MQPNSGDQLLPANGHHPDIPTWPTVPGVMESMIISEEGESRDESEPPDEMKLISDLRATGIPDFDPMPANEATNIPFDNGIPRQMSIRSSPSKVSAMSAVVNPEFILRPLRLSGKGYRRARLDQNLQTRIEDMLSVLRLFLTGDQWIEASQQTAVAQGRGPYYGRVLRPWIHAFILNPASLPTNAWGSGTTCRLDTEDGLQEELQNHLQGIGKYVKAEDLVEYLGRDDTRTRYGATISISITTAKLWMAKLGYHWADTPSGQYVDGHERADVVEY